MKQGRNSFEEPAKIVKRADAPEEEVYALTFSEAFSNFFRKRFSKEAFRRFIENTVPLKNDPKKEIVRKIVRALSVVLLVGGTGYILFFYHGYREKAELYLNLENEIDKLEYVDDLPESEQKKMWEQMKNKYPDVEFPEGMSLKFANLYAMNQDSVGVLRIPEKDLWVPLVQSSTSSPDYYLWKDIHKKYSRYGNPYIDARCDMSKDSFSKNTIIYGHNTHDMLGFNILTSYMSLDGYKEAPVVTLDTLYGPSQWKIFAVILTNSTSSADRGHLFRYLVTDFSSTGEFMGIVDGIYERSMIKTGIDVNKNDKILTLYTCYQDIFEGGRLVIFARLLRDGESADVDTSKASFNYNARYPQAYYDKLKIENPYEDLTESLMDETTSEDIADEGTSAEKNDAPDVTQNVTEASGENGGGEEPVSRNPEEGTESPSEQTDFPAAETTAPAENNNNGENNENGEGSADTVG